MGNPTAVKKFIDPYEAKLKAIEDANPKDEPAPVKQPTVEAVAVDASFKDPSAHKVDYETLKKGAVPGVDPTKKEQYLSDAEFEKVLGSPRGEFNKLKPWKQNQIKKTTGL